MARHESLEAARHEKGVSMPGGRYSIRNKHDLKNAERAVGRTPPSGRAAVRRHIDERAHQLGAPGIENPRPERGDTKIKGARSHNGIVAQRVGE